MADSVARIRPYTRRDDKPVRFTLAKACMEPLAIANHRACTHPMVLALWLALASAFVEYMKWWPNGGLGLLGYLRPLPLFASTAVPIMFFMDWINRPYFEESVQVMLREPDIKDLAGYYGKGSSSGLWILEYGNIFVGVIALDGGTTAPGSKSEKPKKTGFIRHFYIDEPYRKSGIQTDLLEYALEHGFKAGLESIEVIDTPLLSYQRDCLRTAGFRLVDYAKVVGILRWKTALRSLDKDAWLKRDKK
ncbi:hypothetical protein BDN72DRAFT_830218 [Pluteus cervinus]|uniref:Uncharacterized protein n=1 Tax=Pluteus cervinus TaxID=181527 RepID=A0ACD3BFS2_9AGAR|nr:hypothetical protein BDN72DRAFT_830218 [Pluteus cervinus]